MFSIGKRQNANQFQPAGNHDGHIGIAAKILKHASVLFLASPPEYPAGSVARKWLHGVGDEHAIITAGDSCYDRQRPVCTAPRAFLRHRGYPVAS